MNWLAVVNPSGLALRPTAATRPGRRSARVAYGVLSVAMLASVLALLIGSDAAWWPAVAFALAPDLAVVYGIAPGLARGQLHPRAVALHNALHRFYGPIGLVIVMVAAGLLRAWIAGGLAWGFHVAFDRAIGLRLRSPDGFQRGDHR